MTFSLGTFTYFFNNIWIFLGNDYFLFVVSAFSFSLKAFFLTFLYKKGIRKSPIRIAFITLIILIVATMAEDFAWIVGLTRKLFIPSLDVHIYAFIVRIAWGFFVIKYQSLVFFLECLCLQHPRFKLRHVFFFPISLGFFIFFVFSAFFNFFNKGSQLESNLMLAEAIYNSFVLIPTGFLFVLWRLHRLSLPKLIRKQLSIFARFLVVPIFLADFLQSFPFRFFPSFITNSYSAVGISSIVMTCAIYYSARKIMGLRFLNFNRHVRDKKQFEFIDDFKSIIEQFAVVTSIRELAYITKKFFKDAFFVPMNKTQVYIRSTGQSTSYNNYQLEQTYKDLELFMNMHGDFFVQEKILILDELSFDNFYRGSEQHKAALTLLQNIGADVIVPIYNKNFCVGYIVVESDARTGTKKEFYGNVERDQMLIFAVYLGNIIHLLNNKNMDAIIAHEKELQEELYSKHQKINQYQESFRSFIKNEKERKIGIIFYKNRQFMFGNQSAQEQVQINLNTHAGDPLTKAIKRVTQQALSYKTQQTALAQDHNGRKLVLTAIPNSENKGAIIATHYPEISDVLKGRMNVLDDPSKWDYLLYLETTKSGKLINQLVPGSSEIMLRFKIDLLKAALSKKAILLDVPQEDSKATAELLHNLSLRETLHILALHGPTDSAIMGVQLFGANPLLGIEKTHGRPLLEKLDGVGTLFIQNIHFLDKETQDLLAGFLRYGFYMTYKTDQRKTSDVRIICSTDRDLTGMVQEGLFSEELFRELAKTKLVMPSLASLSEQDVHDLADEVTQQAIQDNQMGPLLELTDRERRTITQAQPESMQELKRKISLLLEKKSRESAHHTEHISFLSGADSFELDDALRLGKNALKDKEIMTMLWQKFKNQNKIALFLGVNRSSVNRRLKEYNLNS